MKTLVRFLLGTACLGFASAATAQPARCTSQKHLVRMTINDSGRTMEGPVCAQISVNVLRYDVTLGLNYAAPTAGPVLSAAFPSAFAAGGAVPPPADNLATKFNSYQLAATQIIQGWIVQEAKNRAQAASLSHDLAGLQNVILASDEVFNLHGGAGVLQLLQDPATQHILGSLGSYQNAFQTSDQIVSKLETLQLEVNMLSATYLPDAGAVAGDACSAANAHLLGWASWDKCNDAAYKQLQSTITTELADANLWTSDSDKTTQYVRNLGILGYWQRRISLLNADAFVLQESIPCGVLFNQNQLIAWKVTTTDETGTFPGQTVQQPVPETALNVNCSSAFAVSAGAGFSLIKNPTYAIVQSAPATGSTTPTMTFGVTSNSRVNPYPLALAHARLADWGENRYALHYSFGAGVNPSGGSTGTNPEFLTGLSFSFLRTIFVTCGLDIGKQVSLAGGFHLGDAVPTGVSTVPTSSSYTSAFGFAVTFTKP